MAREINIGDRVAIFATVGKRIHDRVTLHILTANNPYSIVDPKAKPGDRMRFEGDVVYVDEDLGRVRCRCSAASRSKPVRSNW